MNYQLVVLLITGMLFGAVGLRAQAELICDGSTQTVAATGALEDLVIPMDMTVSQIEFTLRGADGGFADLGNGCYSEGGAGATATARFNLGDAEGAIPYGSIIRFVVGVAGEKGTGGTVLGTGSTYGGGGGGTGIMYKAPDSDQWEVLMVAGGGGGAYQGSIVGICVDNKTGQGGQSGTSGGDGNGANGGPGGMVGAGGMSGGLDGFEVSGGGGGAYTLGEGITCVGLDGSTEVGEGQQGFPLGGAGGGNEGCVGSTSRDGGFGFGGGAAGQGGGGGGGGFSGGGGGGSAGRGGGGGSYILNNALSPVIEEGGLSSAAEDGYAQYRCIKSTEPPVEAPEAACIDTTLIVSLNTDGLALIAADLINADTINPALTYSLSATEFSCDSLGERTVILRIEDGETRADSCTATIRIVDDVAPELDCPMSVEVNCDADTSVDALGTATAMDNCGLVDLDMAEIVEFGNCAGSLTITRIWTATDISGNSDSCRQVIVVGDFTAPICNNCPENITVSCDEVPPVPELDVSDTCGELDEISLRVASTQTEDGCGAYAYEETRTWTITDVCGNTTIHEQVITVVDNETPECLDCPTDMTVSCDAVPEVPEVSVTDNCDPEPSVELSVSSTQTDDGSCTDFSYEETRTWTITDACGNAITHQQIIMVTDDTVPECLDCPVDMTVSCDAVPEAPEVTVSDNCDPAPNVVFSMTTTQTDDGSCSEFAYVETRTWTISDACGNTYLHQQVITVVDDAAPEITCPPAVTVTCDNDPSEAGLPTVADNCDPAATFDYQDVVLSGDCDWDCMIERTWTAVDACGNVSTCTQSIQQSVLGLMEDALSQDLDGDDLADPLVIGRLNRHSLTVTAEGATCLLGWMPNNGGSAWPLVREDLLVDGTDCAPAGLPIGADGKMINPLIAETLILGIKLRLDPSVGEVLLSDLDCDIHPIVFQGLPRNPTVADLYKQANLVVGNIIGLPFVEYFASALACINGNYDLCPDDDGDNAGRIGQQLALSLQQPAPAKMRVYPNPVRTQLWLDLSAFNGEQGQLLIYNAIGQRVLERRLNEITSDPVSINTGDLSGGIYLLQLRIGDRQFSEQIVVQGR